MQKIRYSSLAQAIGAFVAGEFEACQCEPERLMVESTEPPVFDSRGIAPLVYEKIEEFSLVAFERHLDGLLSDLVDYCMYPPDGYHREEAWDYLAWKGPVVLVYATTEEMQADTTTSDWQACAQGHAYLQAIAE